MAVDADTGNLLARARAREEQDVRRAREDPAFFIEYCIRDEYSNARVFNAPFHREWHELFDEHPMAVLMAPVGHAKTQQIAVGRTLWHLGRDPNLRIAVVGNTSTQAEKILRSLRSHLERNERLRQVFPKLSRSTREEDPWHATMLTVERTTTSKDPSLQAIGAHGPVNGSRLDRIIIDDLVDFENSRTAEQRTKLIDWFDLVLMTRLYEAGRIEVIGTPWARDDLLHVLGARPGWFSNTYSAVHNPDEAPELWRPIWPQQWSLEQLHARMNVMTASAFVRKYLVRITRDAASRFQTAWFDAAYKLGTGRSMSYDAPRAQGGVRKLPTFTGVDLGIGETEQHARTVIFTIAALDNGRRLLCNVESGRWQAPEIIERLQSAYLRYGSQILVESNAAQKFIVDMCDGRFPVRGQVTGAGNKHSEEFGVESLAVELRRGMWVIPSGDAGRSIDPEVLAWVQECLDYDPSAHTGDRLMASWLAREALRQFGAPQQTDWDALQR